MSHSNFHLMWKCMDNVWRTKIQIQIGINLQTEDTFNWIYIVNIFVSTKNWKKNKNYEFTHKNKRMSFISVVFVGIWYGSIQAIACFSAEADESFAFVESYHANDVRLCNELNDMKDAFLCILPHVRINAWNWNVRQKSVNNLQS